MSEAPYPPAEPPADGDRTSQVPPSAAPRFSASASVPAPPPSTYGPPPNQAGAGAFGQPPFGQGAPQFGQPPAPPSAPQSGSARVGASASVPVPPAYTPNAPGNFGAPPQGYPAQSTVYGQPGGGQPGPQSPPGGQPGGGYGQGGTYAAPPGGYSGGAYGPPAGPHGPQGPGGPQGPPGPGGSPGPQGSQGPGQAGPGHGGAQGGGFYYGPQNYGQPTPEPGRGPRDKMTPTGGWPYVEQSPEPAKKSRKGITIAVIAVAVIIVVAVGGYVGLKLATKGNQFVVGACVKQGGDNSATVVDCSTAGAYRITKVVDTESGCGDTTQPSVKLTDNSATRYACLSPAA